MRPSDQQGSPHLELVPIAMLHALTSAKPQYRYRVGFDSKCACSLRP